MHPGIWFDSDCVYYTISGLFGSIVNYTDLTSAKKIVSAPDFMLNVAEDRNGTLDRDIQAYGDFVYIWYETSSKCNELYCYSIAQKTYEKKYSSNHIINDWAILNDMLVYSTFSDTYGGISTANLWCCNLNDGTNLLIAEGTTAFGIVNNQIRYVMPTSEREALFSFDLKTSQSNLLCEFEGIYGSYNQYNFTSNHLTFLDERTDDTMSHSSQYSTLCTIDITTGKKTSYTLPETLEYMVCYDQYGFLCNQNKVYRINLSDGTTALVCDQLTECNGLYAISEDQVAAVDYKNWGQPKLYFISSDGTMSKSISV